MDKTVDLLNSVLSTEWEIWGNMKCNRILSISISKLSLLDQVYFQYLVRKHSVLPTVNYLYFIQITRTKTEGCFPKSISSLCYGISIYNTNCMLVSRNSLVPPLFFGLRQTYMMNMGLRSILLLRPSAWMYLTYYKPRKGHYWLTDWLTYIFEALPDVFSILEWKLLVSSFQNNCQN